MFTRERRKLTLYFTGVYIINVDISVDESWMAMDILFKPRVEATEQMIQNNISQSKNHREGKIASK